MIRIGNDNFVYLPYSDTINYSVTYSNLRANGSTESIFNPVIVDDLSAIESMVSANCTGAAFTSRITSISDGGVFSTT